MGVLHEFSIVAVESKSERKLYCRNCFPKDFWLYPFGYNIFQDEHIFTGCLLYICDVCGQEAVTVRSEYFDELEEIAKKEEEEEEQGLIAY